MTRATSSTRTSCESTASCAELASWELDHGPPAFLVLLEDGVELARVELYTWVGPRAERELLAQLAREAWAQREPALLRRLASLLYVHRPVHLVDGGHSRVRAERCGLVRAERCGLYGILKGGPIKARYRWSTRGPT